ncbi:MAG: hypothetical protein V4543_05995 [Bacteroidota bacterium]
MRKVFLVFFILSLYISPASADGGKKRTGIRYVTRTNALIADADAAFKKKDFKGAAAKYSYLSDSMQLEDENILSNLALSSYLGKNLAKATDCYERLSKSSNPVLASSAWQQLGVMNEGKPEEALACFKSALKANPANEQARRNFELLKHRYDKDNKQNQQEKDKKEGENKEKKEEEKKDGKNQEKQENKPGSGKGKNEQNKPGENGDKKNQEKQKDESSKEKGDKGKNQEKDQQANAGQDKKQGSKPGENKNEKKPGESADQNKPGNEKAGEQQADKDGNKDSDKKKLAENAAAEAAKNGKKGDGNTVTRLVPNRSRLDKMNLTEEKAMKLLDDMKSNEVQYLQQRRRPASSGEANTGKPQW